ncbi:hypothetical protein C8J56DRAFT_959386 [Mycena floridula]|nr:hypothetical protein C8J56DRAFT_959386 [Mycena floridula]
MLLPILGGLGLASAVNTLLVLNGSVLGLSGFLNRALHHDVEAIFGIFGTVLGGMLVGHLKGPDIDTLSFPKAFISGILVGIGAKLANGCTSGHMLAGISRLSPRSIAATSLFFTFGASSQIPVPVQTPNWSLTDEAKILLCFQAILCLINTPSEDKKKPQRVLVVLSTTFSFSLALQLSGLANRFTVLSFLLLPFDDAFDPTLAYLAVGALPLLTFLYHFRRPEKPRLGAAWSTPKASKIDARLLTGAAFFGCGWAISGLCPGPGLVNVGRGLITNSGYSSMVWLGACAIGGSIV